MFSTSPTSPRPLCNLYSPWLAHEHHLFSLLAFVAAYPAPPEKGRRFIIYALPMLTLTEAVGGAWVRDRRRKGILYALAATAICAPLPPAGVASAGMSATTSWNYPGGEALNRLHTLRAESEVSPLETEQQVVVHLDTFACMTGATRFLQDAPLYHRPPTRKYIARPVRFDKAEGRDDLLSPAFRRGVG